MPRACPQSHGYDDARGVHIHLDLAHARHAGPPGRTRIERLDLAAGEIAGCDESRVGIHDARRAPRDTGLRRRPWRSGCEHRGRGSWSRLAGGRRLGRRPRRRGCSLGGPLQERPGAGEGAAVAEGADVGERVLGGSRHALPPEQQGVRIRPGSRPHRLEDPGAGGSGGRRRLRGREIDARGRKEAPSPLRGHPRSHDGPGLPKGAGAGSPADEHRSDARGPVDEKRHGEAGSGKPVSAPGCVESPAWTLHHLRA